MQETTTKETEKVQKFKCEKCKHIFLETEIVTKTTSGSNCCDSDKTHHCPHCDSQYFKYL